MDSVASKYSVWKRLVHKFQARRDIPFRKRFFVGYDLHGNTYWEFTPDGNMHRLRRKMEPYQEYIFKADYASTIPPQWLQWLRRTRQQAPTLQELVAEQVRQNNMKLLAQQADEKWKSEKLKLEAEQRLKLEAELKKVSQQNPKTASEPQKAPEQTQSENVNESSQPSADPWAEANKANEKDYNPIESANIPLRR